MEAVSRADHPAEQQRLQETKSYLRELTETYDLPTALVEHLSDGESETTFTTIETLFKDFASKLSEECRNREKNLKDTKLKLEMSTSAQATLENEKSDLKEAIKMKDAKLEETGSLVRKAREPNVEYLEAQVKSCATERDNATTELRETQKKLKVAENELNENDIATQKLRFALEDAQRGSQQTAPSIDVDATVSDLHEELRVVKSKKAELERRFERATAAHKRKDDEIAAQLANQDQVLQGMQDKNEKYEKLIQALRYEKEDQWRKASAAKKEEKPITFRVNNEILPLEKYEKLLDNARGDIAKLEERLEQAETDRETIIQQGVPVNEVRKMFMEEIIPLYALAADEAVCNLFNTWEEEDARLLALAGDDGYHKYLHAVVEPDNRPSQASSEGFITRGEAAVGIGSFGSQGSEPASPPPAGLSLESELGDYSRESSMAPEDSQTGQVDSSSELRDALDACQVHRLKADQLVEELKNETKSQRDKIDKLQDEIRKLSQNIAEHENASKIDKQQAQGAQRSNCKSSKPTSTNYHREKADKEIEELKIGARRRSKELRKLKDKFALQQKMGELLKSQVETAQKKASRAKAKAEWAEARLVLQREGADDEEANSSSIDDPEDHHALLSTLLQRVDEAEIQLGKRLQELADIRTMVATLRATIEQLETQLDQLEQERAQLWEDLKVYADSGEEIGQENTTLKEELKKKGEELREKDEDIEEMGKEIRKMNVELEKKNEELKEKQKALDKCHAHGEAVMKQVIELTEQQPDDESQDAESQDAESQDDDRRKEIDRLEEQVADLKRKVKAAEFNASNEAARRREVENKGVWEGTSGAALRSKQTELDNFKKDHDDILQLFEADIKALKERNHADSRAELERIKLEHQQTVDELKAKLEAVEENSRTNAEFEMTRINLEHQKAMDELKSQLSASNSTGKIHEDRLFNSPDSESIRKMIPRHAATQTDETSNKEAATPTIDAQHIPTQAYLDAYRQFKERIEKDVALQDSTLSLLASHLRPVERLHRELLFRMSHPRSSEAQTPGSPGTPANPADDSEHSSLPGDHVSDFSTTTLAIEYERDVALDDINEAVEIFDDLRLRKERFWDDEVAAVHVLFALDAEIAILKKRLKGIEAKKPKENKGDGNLHGAEEKSNFKDHVVEAIGADESRDESSDEESDDEESDDDDQNPGNNPVAIRKRIARLEKKVNKTTRYLEEEERALRSEIDEYEPALTHWINDLNNPSEPRRHRDLTDRAEAAKNAAEASSEGDSSPSNAVPLLPTDPLGLNLQAGRDAWGGRPRAHTFPDADADISDDGSDRDGDQSPNRLRPQEALVRHIQNEMGRVQLYADACDTALNDVYRAAEDLRAIDDPVPRGRGRSRSPSRRSTLPSPSRTVTPDEQAEQTEEEDRRALIRDIAYDDLTSEASSIASADLFSGESNPNRILKSFIPKTVDDALRNWETGTSNLLDRIEMLQGAVEGLVYTGVNSQNYEYLRGRLRRLRKHLAYASSTNAHLRAKISKGPAANTDSELREMVETLGHENNSLKEQLRAADQAIRATDARDKRQRQLEQEINAARARADVEETYRKKLADEKEQLQKTVQQLERSKEEAIQDGLDREMRETLFAHEELKKEAAGLRDEVTSLRGRLTNELLARGAPLETAQVVIRGMADRLGEAQKRVEVAEDMRSTLMTDIELALEVDAEDDTERLERTRLRLSNILCRVKEAPNETDGQSGEDAGEEEEEESNGATSAASPGTGRERELTQQILFEKKKRAGDLAAERRTHDERINKRQAEYEKQIRDWEDMYNAAEESRKLSENNRIDALERIRVLESEADWLKKLNSMLNGQLEEQCTANPELAEELNDEDGLGEDEKTNDYEGSAGDPADGSEPGQKPQKPRGPQEQPGGATGGDPDDDPGDGSSDGSGDDGGKVRLSLRWALPLPENPVFDGLPAGAQDVVKKFREVYNRYRGCCGQRGGDTAETPEDDGLLVWRLLGVMRADTDIREQIQNAGRNYIARLLLAFWSCLRVHFSSWRQSLFSVVHGFLYYAIADRSAPKRVAIVVKDLLMGCLFYYTYRVLAATWAVQKIWEMANGYTRAYFIERGLHPERSTWFGVDGIDMRLRGFSSESGTLPYSTGIGEGVTG
ncbi:LOW QUALITY PROTEIN: hypothetical protein Ct61P_10336 [Colletotrichum tofieldiae]|nr:LOW QUALITY PROTEIN: hypothetical protein Ct61P_10336 [Colletotrichum tofieldiae]